MTSTNRNRNCTMNILHFNRGGYFEIRATCANPKHMMERIAAATITSSLILILVLSSNYLGSHQRSLQELINKMKVNTVQSYQALESSNDMTVKELKELEAKLQNAALDNNTRTVVIAALNKAWAEGGMFDNFLASFHEGDGILYLLDHLVVVSLDSEAHNICMAKHKHCFNLSTPGVNFSQENVYMTDTYLKTMKRKVQFLGAVLQLGFSFIFTDVDIVWFRTPFQHFSKHADIDISCNHDFNGNSLDMNNQPNGGLLHVNSNPRTISFYKYWYQQHEVYPEKHDQDVLNAIKFSDEFREIGVRVRFVPTDYFSGYCRLSSDMEKVCTMHAICCIGQERKIAALKTSMEDWKLFKSMTPQESKEAGVHFRAPHNCL